LAPSSVEGEHEQLPEVLAERVLAAERVELVDQLPMAALCELRLGAGLDGYHGQFLDVGSLGLREVGVGKLARGSAAAQLKSLAQGRRPEFSLALGQ